jgi:hypothetical protein
MASNVSPTSADTRNAGTKRRPSKRNQPFVDPLNRPTQAASGQFSQYSGQVSASTDGGSGISADLVSATKRGSPVTIWCAVQAISATSAPVRSAASCNNAWRVTSLYDFASLTTSRTSARTSGWIPSPVSVGYVSEQPRAVWAGVVLQGGPDLLYSSRIRYLQQARGLIDAGTMANDVADGLVQGQGVLRDRQASHRLCPPLASCPRS